MGSLSPLQFASLFKARLHRSNTTTLYQTRHVQYCNDEKKQRTPTFRLSEDRFGKYYTHLCSTHPATCREHSSSETCAVIPRYNKAWGALYSLQQISTTRAAGSYIGDQPEYLSFLFVHQPGNGFSDSDKSFWSTILSMHCSLDERACRISVYSLRSMEVLLSASGKGLSRSVIHDRI